MATKEQDQQLNVQPQSIEAEQAVLGSMLASKDAISKALQWVRSHHFYKEAHGKIYLVMTDLFDKGEPIDTVSVINRLKKNKELRKKEEDIIKRFGLSDTEIESIFDLIEKEGDT